MITANKPVCPECRDDKHHNCIGYAMDTARDKVVVCSCTHPPTYPRAA